MTASRRVLDPLERLSEVLFGLIMALSFTGSLSIASAGREEVRTMLVGALGCNLAWGLVDAVMYLLATLVTRARGLATLKSLRQAAEPATAHQIIAEALPPILAASVRDTNLEHMRQDLLGMRDVPARVRPTRDDWRGALGVFLLVFLSTFPVAIPFLFFHEPLRALRVSNAVAVVMLFFAGRQLGKYAGTHATRLGLVMVALGVVLVGVTIALGG